MQKINAFIAGLMAILLLAACNNTSEQNDTQSKGVNEAAATYTLNNSEKSYVLIQSMSDEIAGNELTEEEDSVRTLWVYEQVQKVKKFNTLFNYKGLKISSVQYNDHDGYSTLIAVRGFNTLKPAIDYSKLFINEMDETLRSLFDYVVPITYSDYRKSMDKREIDKYYEYYSNLKNRK
jgi:hypothetical protein